MRGTHQYKYPGIILGQKGTSEAKVEKRLALGKQAFRKLQSKRIRKDTNQDIQGDSIKTTEMGFIL